MSTTEIHTRSIVGAVGAAFATVAVPALLFIGAGVAHADPAASVPQAHGTTTITERPGHIAIETHPAPVTPPLVWGPFPSLLALLSD